MSDAPQGPGWWIASDGRWYPPESHPSRAAPPPPPSTLPPTAPPASSFLPPSNLPPSSSRPGVGPPPVMPPSPYGVPPRTGMSSTAKVLLIVTSVLVLAVAGCVAAAGVLVNRASHTLATATFPSPVSTIEPNTFATVTFNPVITPPAPNIVPAEPGPTMIGVVPCPAADGSSPRAAAFTQAPPMCIDPARAYQAVVTTNLGSYTVVLDAARAPVTVNNFVVLARYHYFDASPCHRIIGGFMAQCGDPTGTGYGGDRHAPGYTFADENLPADKQYRRGDVAMANAGSDTNGSQFFTLLADWDASTVPGGYSLFGHVTDGLDTTLKALEAAADPATQNGIPPRQPVTILTVTITES